MVSIGSFDEYCTFPYSTNQNNGFILNTIIRITALVEIYFVLRKKLTQRRPMNTRLSLVLVRTPYFISIVQFLARLHRLQPPHRPDTVSASHKIVESLLLFSRYVIKISSHLLHALFDSIARLSYSQIHGPCHLGSVGRDPKSIDGGPLFLLSSSSAC